MNPRQQAINNRQRSRRKRGHDFQEEIRQSLRFIPNLWTIEITDGKGGSRPGDRLILTEEVNILAELKRTSGKKFNLSFLRPNQIQGLVDFDSTSEKNIGLVLVSFHNPKRNLDETYAFRLVTALQYMKNKDIRYLSIHDLRNKKVPVVKLPKTNGIYDLKGLISCRSL